MAKDRFRDWGLYHKSIVAAIAAFVLGVAVRAVLVIDGAFELKDEIVLEASTAEIWPWVVENLKRPNWQGEVMRVQGLSSDIGRNRLVYWKRGYDTWRSYEVTTALVQERVFRAVQESDFDKRWWEVELVPEGVCRTRVKFREVIQPTLYRDRFWFFRVEEERQQRLQASAAGLKRWVMYEKKACDPSAEAAE